MNRKLFVISGCSGVGKSTVLNEFMAKNSADFILSVSCTTRKPRRGEVDGVNYFFLSKEEFQDYIEQDKFLEYAQFAGNYYGTKKKFINRKLEEGFNIVLEIETQGALQVKKKMPEAVLIFIAPPGVNICGNVGANKTSLSLADIAGGLKELEKRLRGRDTEDEQTIQKRLGTAKTELEYAGYYDYIITNDDLGQAVFELESIINKEIS